MKTVAVIGGGASGMLAALTAAENPLCRVILFEKQARIGKKLLVTGNGRCNLTNTNALTVPGHYHGAQPEFSLPAMKAFPPEAAVAYFRRLGLVCTEQYGGRVYPLSDAAGSVLDVLRYALDSAGVDMHVEERISLIRRKGKGFLLHSNEGLTGSASGAPSHEDESTGPAGADYPFDSSLETVYHADSVIIACGGLSGGKNGGSSDGYGLLKSLGHHCTKLYPALVPVRTDTDFPRSLKGIRADAEIRLYRDEKHGFEGSPFTGFSRNTTPSVKKKEGSLRGQTSCGAAEAAAPGRGSAYGRQNPYEMAEPAAIARGELQFVERGISGPAAFDISREASAHGGTLVIDFLRALSVDNAVELLSARRDRSPLLELSALFAGILQSRLGLVIVKAAGFRPSGLISELTDRDLRVIAETAKGFTLRVTGTDSFDAAQVTVGGINTSEFEPETLESRLVPGLYACGEVLDIDGDCGGYNLQWAWASGRLAGQRACL